MKVQSRPKVRFYNHDLGEPELNEVRRVLAGPILTTGETVSEFEKKFAFYTSRNYTLGVTSCTGALHMSLIALGIGPGDEVITTPMTFIASATAILEAGARPVFVDVEPDTGNLNAAAIPAAVTHRTKAILPVHLYGQMCDMRTLRTIADRHKLKLIEDCAHCLEGERDGIRPGQLSDTACYSFYATKSITSGEGGAVATDHKTLHEKLRLLRLHGMNKTAADRHREGYQHWDMPVLGWKYNMDNIQAALLLPQLERIQDNLKKRQRLAAHYQDRLENTEGVRTFSTRPNVLHARHLFAVRVENGLRDRVIEGLKQDGIEVMVNYNAVHLLTYFAEHYGYRRGQFPIAEKIGDETLSLPLYANMPLEHVDWVVQSIQRILEETK